MGPISRWQKQRTYDWYRKQIISILIQQDKYVAYEKTERIEGRKVAEKSRIEKAQTNACKAIDVPMDFL